MERQSVKLLASKFEQRTKSNPPPKPLKPANLQSNRIVQSGQESGLDGKSRLESGLDGQSRLEGVPYGSKDISIKENSTLKPSPIHPRSSSFDGVKEELGRLKISHQSSTASLDAATDIIPRRSLRERNTPTSAVLEPESTKRNLIIQEIIDTEKSFLNDLMVLKNVYVVPCQKSQALPAQDQKLLFGNLEKIIQVSTDLNAIFQDTFNSKEQLFGAAFLDMAKPIEKNYAEYCKYNDACLTRLSEYAGNQCPPSIKTFLNECRLKLQGQTGAWDLGSLIVKPVQRVLKYPLLIKTLLKETSEDHADFRNLSEAHETFEKIAVTINKVKKRKDVVEKYVGKKGGHNLIHGISKKWNRGTQFLKKNIGLTDEITQDVLYDALAERFELFQDEIVHLHKEMSIWIQKLKEQFLAELAFANSFLDFFSFETSPPSFNKTLAGMHQYRTACSQLMTGPWKIAETQVSEKVLPCLDTLLALFKPPLIVMKKRAAKLLDYERLQEMKEKNEPIDKQLAESADEYTSINEQLLEDLPKFLTFASEYVQTILMEAIEIQASLYKNLWQSISLLCDSLSIDQSITTDQIITEHMAKLGPESTFEIFTRAIPILSAWYDKSWNTGVKNDRPLKSSASNTLIDITGAKAPPKKLVAGDIDNKIRQAVLSNDILQPKKLNTKLMPKIDSRFQVEPFEAKALYDFQAELDDEITLLAGDIVSVLFNGGRPDCDDGWWYGEKNGKGGWFPAAFVDY